MITPFVPDDFMVPNGLTHDQFHFKILEPSVNDLDYEAVMSSRENLRSVFAANDLWPADDMTLADNLNDLITHEKEFLARGAFAYTVLNMDKTKCIGCIYIEPSHKKGIDTEVYYWIRDDSQDLFETFENTLKSWLKTQWPFEIIAYPGREVSWQKWGKRSYNHI